MTDIVRRWTSGGSDWLSGSGFLFTKTAHSGPPISLWFREELVEIQ